MVGNLLSWHPGQPGRLPRRVTGSDLRAGQVTRRGVLDPHYEGGVSPPAAVLARDLQLGGHDAQAYVDPVDLLAGLADGRVPRRLAAVDGAAERGPGAARLHVRGAVAQQHPGAPVRRNSPRQDACRAVRPPVPPGRARVEPLVRGRLPGEAA